MRAKCIYTPFLINTDYMYDRSIQGSTDWHKVTIVLEIPHDTSLIDFGVWIIGKGEVQVDEFSFQVVDPEVNVTGISQKIVYGDPENLNFEEK